MPRVNRGICRVILKADAEAAALIRQRIRSPQGPYLRKNGAFIFGDCIVIGYASFSLCPCCGAGNWGKK
jgi:hypothetical protein